MDDDIIRMAREAQQEHLSVDGRSPSTALNGYWFSMEVADLARFAALVRADERKRIKAEPVEPVAWVGDPSTQDYASTVPGPQVADRLARHGIPMPGDPK